MRRHHIIYYIIIIIDDARMLQQDYSDDAKMFDKPNQAENTLRHPAASSGYGCL